MTLLIQVEMVRISRGLTKFLDLFWNAPDHNCYHRNNEFTIYVAYDIFESRKSFLKQHRNEL